MNAIFEEMFITQHSYLKRDEMKTYGSQKETRPETWFPRLFT
jgi:hypothetical protein